MSDGADQHDADRASEALEAAMVAAEQIVGELNERWSGAGEDARVFVLLGAGSEDQPLFSFVLALALPDDFDADEWPSEHVARLDAELRSSIADSPVDDWDWLITARAAAKP